MTSQLSMLVWLMFIVGCVSNQPTPEQTTIRRTADYDQQIRSLIAQDADNKRYARLMLHEIDVAILNDDYTAYVFFLDEYEKIPGELVPPEHRDEPGYVQPISQLESFFRINLIKPALAEPNKPIPPHAQ